MSLFVAPDTVDGIQLMMGSAVVDKYWNEGLIVQKKGERKKYSLPGETSLPNQNGLATGGWAHAVYLSVRKEAKASRQEEESKWFGLLLTQKGMLWGRRNFDREGGGSFTSRARALFAKDDEGRKREETRSTSSVRTNKTDRHKFALQ